MSKLYTAPASDLQAKADAFDWIAEHCDVEVTDNMDYHSAGHSYVFNVNESDCTGNRWDETPMTLLQWVEREKGK